MAVTLVPQMTGGATRRSWFLGDRDLKLVVGKVTMDSSYADGGEPFTPANIGLDEVYLVLFSPPTSGSGDAKFNVLGLTYDYTNNKVIAYGGSAQDATQSGAMAALQSGNNLAAFSSRFIAIGY